MSALGQFRFVLHPGVSPSSFEAVASSLDPSSTLQLTRVTSGFDGRLLKVVPPGGADAPAVPPAQYLWEVTVHTVDDRPYDFGQNAERVQAALAELGTLVSVETLAVVTPAGS